MEEKRVQGSGFRVQVNRIPDAALMVLLPIRVSWHFLCGSGFPAATIEAERLSHKRNLAGR
jgi:hypothetical protein